MAVAFLEDVKKAILEAKFVLEQDKSLPGIEKAIDKLRDTLDMCNALERQFHEFTPKPRKVADSLYESLARPRFESFTNEKDPKDKP